jgi:hypothetical protein
MLCWRTGYVLKRWWTTGGEDYETLGCVLQHNGISLTIAVGYRSSLVSNTALFLKVLDGVIGKIISGNQLQFLYISGDFNLDLLARCPNGIRLSLDILVAKHKPFVAVPLADPPDFLATRFWM